MKNTSKISLVCLLLLQTAMCFAQMSKEQTAIDKVLTQWHKAASEANFDTYFSYMTNDGVFIGTDATENWQNKAFKEFSKPYFDKGKAWSFTAIDRNIYVDEQANIAWFDELLDTQMKICRGSGVLKKVDGAWKIKHYVLSMTIPNEKVSEVVSSKEAIENKLIEKLNN
ncbi:MAG: nuclear transport factor 2 family protein [Flavobacteriaceae bacterium]